MSGSSFDVLEIDGASNNSVDDIREIRDNVRYTSMGGKYRIYVIDEVHMLSKSAFNALLKTLEEPPKNVIFIFATTEPQKNSSHPSIRAANASISAGFPPSRSRPGSHTYARRKRSRSTRPRSRSWGARPKAACATR